MNYKKAIVQTLMDKYEKSITFRGENRTNQRFRADMGKLFPKYLDDAEYEVFRDIEEVLEELSADGIIRVEPGRDGRNRIAVLCPDAISEAYQLTGRTPRKDTQKRLAEMLAEKQERLYEKEQGTMCGENREDAEDRHKGYDAELMTVLKSYIGAQLERIEKNQDVEYFDGSFPDYEDLWKLLFFLGENEEEQFVRDVSVKLFSDSKRLESLRGKAEGLLYKYGEYEKKEGVLEEYGIVKNPSHIYMKGKLKILLSGQEIDLGQLEGDLAVSSKSLGQLKKAELTGKRLVTIENLTSFHRYSCGETDAAVYLGGFHNHDKKVFLKRLYQDNPEKEYRHFGDIDVGGFYIYLHLKRKTGIPFRTVSMDTETLLRHEAETKPLTANDRVRLKKLRERLREEGETRELPVVEAMLERGRKLEQEAVENYAE